jgi:hypothetical protein
VASIVVLGFPLKPVTKLARKSVEDFTTVDTFGGPAFRAP